MVRRLFSLLSVVTVLIGFSGRLLLGAPADFKAADALFEKHSYQPALERYAALSKDPGENGWKARYRAAECEALLFRYLEAANRMLDAALPQEPLWKARFLLLRAELGREYLNQYGWNLTKDTESGATDRARWTAETWHKEIRAQYSELARLEPVLRERALGAETYFIETEKRDTSAYPTLWDFAVFRATDYLLSEFPAPAAGLRPAPERFLDDSFGTSYGETASPAEQAASLAERAAKSREPGPGELWKLFRLNVAFRFAAQTGFWKDQKAGRAKAVSRLKRWGEAFQSERAKADALYRAAELLEIDESFAEAVALCKDVERLYPKTVGVKDCSSLRARIELPQLNSRFFPTQPGAKDTLTLSVRNLEEIHLRLYATDLATLRKLRGGEGDAVEFPSNLPHRAYEEFLLKKPDVATQFSLTYGAPHAVLKKTLTVPTVKPGLYAAFLSSDKHFEPNRSVMSAGVLNVTELFLFGSSGAPASFALDKRRLDFPAFHLYAVDGNTGEPAPDARFETALRLGWGTTQTGTVSADKAGQADVASHFTQDYQYQTLQAIARRGDHHAYFATPLTLQHTEPEKYSLHLDADRPIYRPGQTLSFKVTALENLSPGWRVSDGKKTIQITATDPNGKSVHSVSLKPNAYGSASGKFTIPTGRLLGSYSLRAEIKEGTKAYTAYRMFEVEEYKRPEFEVKVEEAKGPWKFGIEATVEGDVSYYFGGGVPTAAVSYRVTRETFIPWFCWWWRWRQPQEAKDVASGTISTDDKGHFKFTLTPNVDPEEENKNPLPAGYQVEIEARDSGGRTIKASRRFQAAASGALLAVETPSGFLKAGSETVLSAGFRTLNDSFVEAKGSYQVMSLTMPSPFPARDPEEPLWRGRQTNDPIDRLLETIPDGAEVTRGSFAGTDKGLGKLRLAALKPGLYRLKLSASDPSGGDLKLALILVVANDKGLSTVPQVTLAEHPKYVVGETARVLLGSTEIRGKIFVEIWRGPDLFKRETLPGGAHLVSVPVTDALKGGFSVRWFGVNSFHLWNGETSVEVPWREKELSVLLQSPNAVKPGEKVSWALKVQTYDNKSVDGEGTIRVFDRSLEYYATDATPWASSLYPASPPPTAEGQSYFVQWTQGLPVEPSWLEKQVGILRGLYDSNRVPPPPSLRPFESRYRGNRHGYGRAMLQKGDAESYAMDGAGGAAPPASAPMNKKMAGAAPEQAVEKKETSAVVRSDMSETALFEPHLAVKDGKATLNFRAPERLTSWRVSGSVLTKDVRTGVVSADFATRKEIMVRVEAPRFFREGDRGVLKAIVHNETKQALTAEVQLALTKNDVDAAAAFTLKDAIKSISVPPSGVGTVSWTIRAPKDFGQHKVRAIARSGKLVDAEEREFPVLPSRSRLVESKVAYLEGDEKETFQVPSHVKGDELESATLQVDPQLAGMLLNSLPQLVLYPHDCTEQLIDRLVPLSLVHRLFQKYPELKEAAAKVPQRKTRRPSWDLADPRRLTDLAETPWAVSSKGYEANFPTADLTRDAIVQKIANETLQKLESQQMPNGAFPWFAGGKADLYLTLYVLEGFEALLRHDIKIPEPLVKKAFQYVLSELKTYLKPDEPSLSLGLYGAFILSAYAEKYSWASGGKEMVSQWLSFAEANSRTLTAYGLAYAAWISSRLGDETKAQAYLERALSGSRKDKVMGVYWQPEKLSWLWYHDTDEKHAFLLRTLQKLKPKDPRLPGLVQWLLFSRKGNEWKSTRTSAAALYALIGYFEAKGALKGDSKYQWSWGARGETTTLKATDFLAKPLRWTFASAPSSQSLQLTRSGPGIGIASLTTIFSTDNPAAHANSSDNLIQLERRVFKRVKTNLEKLSSGDQLSVGDVVEVQFVINSRSAFEYLHLKAPRPAGFEPETLTSGWQWDQLSRYEEIRDSMENFFISWLPQGEFVLRYRLRATTAGEYKFGATLLQSMYAPEFSAYTTAFTIKVKE